MVTAKSKKPGFKASTEESAILIVIADTKEHTKKSNAATSDPRKKANQVRVGNATLSSTEQEQYDKRRAMDKRVIEKRRIRRVEDQYVRGLHESQATPVKLSDVNPIIRLGWFYYDFATTVL